MHILLLRLYGIESYLVTTGFDITRTNMVCVLDGMSISVCHIHTVTQSHIHTITHTHNHTYTQSHTQRCVGGGHAMTQLCYSSC